MNANEAAIALQRLMALTQESSVGQRAQINGHDVVCRVRVQKNAQRRSPGFYFTLDGNRAPFSEVVSAVGAA